MKESIEYYYNISINELTEDNSIYSFYLNELVYILVPFNRNINEVNDILEVSKELKSKRVPVFDIMYNRKNEVITSIDNINYLLLKLSYNYKEEVDIFVIVNNNFFVTQEYLKNYKNNWADLWSKKIDYYEYQVSELGKNKKIILDSFSYYVGLAENAIAIVNKMNSMHNNGSNEKLVLSHRRIFYPNINLNYYNPISFIFDLESRDISEYIKSVFFSGNDALFELSIYLKSKRLNEYNYNMLFARLLYPTYYFDIYEKIMTESEDEKKLLEVVKLVDEYEIFLKKVYIELSKYSTIENVGWITQ